MHHQEIMRRRRGDRASLKGIWSPVFRIIMAVAIPVSMMTTNSLAQDIKILKTKLKGGVTNTNPAIPATKTSDNILPDGFSFRKIAEGTDPLENPSGVITTFGNLNNASSTATEPDQNTYLVLDDNPGGPTPDYDYGRQFLFQGHENSSDLAYVTRINLDVIDPAHRITLLTPVGADGLTHFNSLDGSVWNPFTNTLLFTQEAGFVTPPAPPASQLPTGGVIEVPVDWPSTPRTLYGILGRGGFEGIHPDDEGNLYIAEDVGGTKVNINPNDANSVKTAANPNSFIYRFVPYKVSDLSAGGKLQALQVRINGDPVTFVPVDVLTPFGDVFSTNQLKLHTLGTSWPVGWVTVHDTAKDGMADFDASAAAKKAGATPFKRPENLAFLPGSGFNTFFFDATGDTDATAGNVASLAARGAWGAIFRVDLNEQSNSGKQSKDTKQQDNKGRISIFALGDQKHASFDNLTFVDKNVLLAAEDRGDTLHDQLNILDSVWAYDLRKPNADPVRFIALGRDTVASVPSGEDNEPTGVLFSDGDPSVAGLLGHKSLDPDDSRLFFTQQHGDNTVYEVQATGQ
jgi:Bacterial protein of unknown function (DUF839)